MVVVGQDDLGAEIFQVLGGEGFDCSIGANRHKNGGRDSAVGSGDDACAAMSR